MTTSRCHFCDLSITWKLVLLTTVTGSVALLLASIAFAYQDARAFKKRTTHEIATLAKVISANSAAPLVFDDPGAAEGILAALSAEPQLIRADLFNAEARRFATYQRPGATSDGLLLDTTGPRIRTEHGHLILLEEVLLDGQVVGHLQIESSMEELRTHLLEMGRSILGVFVIAVLAGLVISLPIQGALSKPLLRLADAAQLISKSNDYSIRVATQGNDEVGLVTDSFNEMVTQIELQEKVLQDTHRQLQTKVEDLKSEIEQRRAVEESLRENKEALRQAHKLEAVGLLAGGVAHDFNNLLTAIIGFSELILRSLDPKDRLCSMIREVKTAGERGAALTQQLLAFSRKQILETKVLDLNSTVEDSAKLLRRLVGEDVEIEARPDASIGSIKVDPGQLQQILWNLAVNSRDAMPTGGKLVIETGHADIDEHQCSKIPELQPGAYVTLSVRDTGCGIKKALLERIFEPFFTTKEQGNGTGLGLSTVYGIVKQSGGHISVDSAEGEGTTFRIYFPELDEAPLAARELESRPPARGETRTVLLVEDEPVVRELAKRTLQLGGYSVLVADGGEEAIRIFGDSGGGIDLLVTDIIMPRMNGREVYEQLAAMKLDLKVLFMSGHTDRAIVHHGVLHEGTPFLRKPFSLDQLLNKVRETLGATGAKPWRPPHAEDSPPAEEPGHCRSSGARA